MSTSLAINGVDNIQAAFSGSLDRLGLASHKLEVENDRFPIDWVTHPYVLLGRMAMTAEEMSILIFNTRIFPNTCFIADSSTPTGIVIADESSLTSKQLMDRNVQEANRFDTASLDNMTVALREMMIDSAIVECLEIDQENKILRIKPHNFRIQSMYAQAGRFNDGAGLPLLSPAMLAINQLMGMLDDEASMLAMNKAREKASDLLRDLQQRRENAMQRDALLNEAGYDSPSQ